MVVKHITETHPDSKVGRLDGVEGKTLAAKLYFGFGVQDSQTNY